jgi:hypothetical protein
MTVTTDGQLSSATAEAPEAAPAQELPYTKGSVWLLTMIRVKPEAGYGYFRDLGATWKQVMEEAKKDGLVLSYKLLSGSASDRDDWNLLLMTEVPNMAAFDGDGEERFVAISRRIIGDEHKLQAMMEKRSEVRDSIGSKMMRELILK